MSRVGEQQVMNFEKEVEEELTFKEWEESRKTVVDWGKYEAEYMGDNMPYTSSTSNDKSKVTNGMEEQPLWLVGTLDGRSEGTTGLKQVGGTHYNKHTIQPWDIIDEYELGYYTGNIIKYVLRSKGNRLEDLKKAQHYLEKEIAEWE